ncbi:MAG TPA: reverse transcriptase, partial [Plasticicumulans sp.]|nr:reverse transcriptase [Plasticicumulans sp.]
PNTGHMQIWLQRMTLPIDKSIDYAETICKVVAGTADRLWNNDWISSAELKAAIDATKIVDISMRDGLSPVIPLSEVELFLSKVTEGYYS